MRLLAGAAFVVAGVLAAIIGAAWEVWPEPGEAADGGGWILIAFGTVLVFVGVGMLVSRAAVGHVSPPVDTEGERARRGA